MMKVRGPMGSVPVLEKLARLTIALCKVAVSSRASGWRALTGAAGALRMVFRAVGICHPSILTVSCAAPSKQW